MSVLPRVLVADSSDESRTLIVQWLQGERCEIAIACDGPGVVACAGAQPPDLILLGYEMPGLNGVDVCRHLRSDPANNLRPIVLISSSNDLTHRVKALEVGADDFLSRPLERSELVARVRSMLRLKSLQDRLESTWGMVLALARAAEAKDSFGHEHEERVAESSCRIAERIGFDEAEIDQVRAGALIHDIGKIAIKDVILNKPGPLTATEFEAVKQHCEIGANIVAPLTSRPMLRAIVRHHHERFDGEGYPAGLAGDAIPLAARIVAICDSFDAMVSLRSYRAGMPESEAIKILIAGRDKQWDGRLVDLFLETMSGHASALSIDRGPSTRLTGDTHGRTG